MKEYIVHLSGKDLIVEAEEFSQAGDYVTFASRSNGTETNNSTAPIYADPNRKPGVLFHGVIHLAPGDYVLESKTVKAGANDATLKKAEQVDKKTEADTEHTDAKPSHETKHAHTK